MAKQNLPDDNQRLGQIKEGAGLEDSKINQEFVEFIRKWSTPVLLIAAAVAVGYFLYNKRVEARQAHVDRAFAQYNESSGTFSPSPDALRRIAEDFDDVKGVSIMARTAAADEYLRAVQRGIRPGSPLNQLTGEPENEEDFLNDEDRDRLLAEAESLYREVWNETEGNAALAIHTLGALYGLAAVAESRLDLDAARNTLDQARALAEDRGFIEHVALASRRIEALPRLARVSLPNKADIPLPPEPEPEETEVPETDTTVGPALPDDATDAGEPGASTEVVDPDADDAAATDSSGNDDTGADDEDTGATDDGSADDGR